MTAQHTGYSYCLFLIAYCLVMAARTPPLWGCVETMAAWTPLHAFCTSIKYKIAVRPAAVGRLLFLQFVRNVFHHVLHPAIQDLAEHVDGVGADEFVALQAGDLAWADVMAVNQGVLGHALFAHGFPQATI